MRFFAALVLFSLAQGALAQNWGEVAGRVTEKDSGAPLPGVTVLVNGTNFGTASDEQGRYSLRLPEGRYLLRFSAVGFAARLDSAHVRRDRTFFLDVVLTPETIELEGVTVEGRAVQEEAGVYEVDPRTVQDIPMPVNDGLRALKTMPGVATNNELSNQYSVRGGGFNENLIFINGFEIFLPFRPRQGEQEGLSLLNIDLAERMTFYTGGFPARYGGKLSSALDVQYRRPNRTGAPLSGSAYASLLDAGLSGGASALDGRLGWLVGFRKSRPRRFFATQELQGDYNPDFTDLQALLTFTLAPGHELEALGMWAEHTFTLDPSARKTFFGTLSQDSRRAPSNLKSIWISYDAGSEERDGYATRFAGLRLSNRLTPALRLEHDVSYFHTVEDEVFQLSGSSVLFQVDPGSENPQGGEGLFPIGNSRQEEHANNRVRVTTWTGQSRWQLLLGRHVAEAGLFFRHLTFNDRLDEATSVTGRSTDGDVIRIVANELQDSASLSARQAGFYLQDSFDVLPGRPGRFTFTGGLRADYFSFNDELTLSPRFSTRFRLDERTTLLGAWGIYYQTPTYRELRGQPEPGETILGALNRNLKSQRSMQFVAGVEHFLPKQRFYLRGEAYYKDLHDLITYDIENVRVLYSGENDADGYAYGFDLQLRGEFVPGLESWVNYSFLVARERFKEAFVDEYRDGSIPRPTDQRHTVSLFVQDYIPGDTTWKIHLRTLFGSGLPYTPPRPGPKVGNLVTQVPGERFSARYPRYFRFDMGLTKHIAVFEHGISGPVRLELTGEILNVFNMVNTVEYTWVPDAAGIWTRIPTRLTPRTVNVRLRVDF
ncbi:MAG: TonB-dependent receptor [Rhodothermaceae bacterium]|uniref:TonB-dependent receptor n=1 Tax=Rhodocaloribacter litoris TaxID=2558931 RepID=UPI001E51984E|nr:TonB-dependent receptor [Rhodocaloribacter litoris]GIV59600.1 MAG: TonB-dependent receptor [Rhodothermaceae bacterium]